VVVLTQTEEIGEDHVHQVLEIGIGMNRIAAEVVMIEEMVEDALAREVRTYLTFLFTT
jgi:hypothetical protein